MIAWWNNNHHSFGDFIQSCGIRLRFAAKVMAASNFNMMPNVTQVACRRLSLAADS